MTAPFPIREEFGRANRADSGAPPQPVRRALLAFRLMNKRYNAADIEVLSGLDPVKRRPGMYTDTARPNHLAQEVIDNSVDEALGGHAKTIEVTLHSDGSWFWWYCSPSFWADRFSMHAEGKPRRLRIDCRGPTCLQWDSTGPPVLRFATRTGGS